MNTSASLTTTTGLELFQEGNKNFIPLLPAGQPAAHPTTGLSRCLDTHPLRDSKAFSKHHTEVKPTDIYQQYQILQNTSATPSIAYISAASDGSVFHPCPGNAINPCLLGVCPHDSHKHQDHTHKLTHMTLASSAEAQALPLKLTLDSVFPGASVIPSNLL